MDKCDGCGKQSAMVFPDADLFDCNDPPYYCPQCWTAPASEEGKANVAGSEVLQLLQHMTARAPGFRIEVAADFHRSRVLYNGEALNGVAALDVHVDARDGVRAALYLSPLVPLTVELPPECVRIYETNPCEACDERAAVVCLECAPEMHRPAAALDTLDRERLVAERFELQRCLSPCTHEARKGRHEWYVRNMDGVKCYSCRSCGASYHE